MKRIFTWISGILIVACASNAQTISDEYGNISEFEKNYTSVDYDSSASAVVFFKKTKIGYETGDKGYVKTITKKYRAKILKPGGRDFARSFKIRYRRDFEFEKFRFHTINYNNGERIVKELREDDYFETKVYDDIYERTIILENIKTGSIFEYEVAFSSKQHYYINDFYFQERVPVLEAEFHAKIPSFYYFRVFFLNCDTIDVKTTNEYKQYMNLAYLGMATTEGAVDVKGLEYHFKKKNIEAFRPVSHVSTPDNLRQKIIFPLTATHYPGYELNHIMTTWSDLHKKIVDHDKIFKKALNYRKYEKCLPKELSIDKGADKDVKAIYNFVKEKTIWNEDYDVFSENKIKDVLEGKSAGSTADINLGLIGLLRSAGFDASPVLISTRFHGEPYKEYPVFNVFNSLICYVKTSNKEYLLDAHNADYPMGIMPEENLNYEGFLVKKDTGYWIPIKDKVPTISRAYIGYTFNSNTQEIQASSKMEFFGQKAVKLTHHDFVENRFPKTTNIINERVTNITVNRASGNNLKQTITGTFTLKNDILGDVIYFQPNIFKISKLLPEALSNRLIPIEQDYPEGFMLTYSMEVPSDYYIEELPKPITFALPDKSASIQFNCFQNGNNLFLSYKIIQTKSIFMPNEFSGYQDFLRQLIKIENTAIVMKKIKG